MIGGLALGAAASTSAWRPSYAQVKLPDATASAERLDPRRVHLRWSGVPGPVTVLASSDANAPASLMRVLASDAPGNELTVDVGSAPRPYFLIEGPDGARLRVAERLLPLEAGRNFRDLGGYVASNGKALRWGRIYRSGVMSGLTANDLTYLAELGIETVCDLRSDSEIAGEPPPFSGMNAPRIVTFGYKMEATMASMGALFVAKTREEAVRAFASSYLEMADFLTPHYTDMFARLMRRETPLAFNCSAGKDRTGLAAALILSVLGVPRETVIADYALSEFYVPPDKYIAEMRTPTSQGPDVIPPQQRQLFSRMPDPVLRVMMGTDPEVMQMTLASIDAKFGGPIALAKTRYGLDDVAIDYLRTVYLA